MTVNAKTRLRIATAIQGIELSAGMPEYRLAMELLCGGTERTIKVKRTLWQRLRDALACAWTEFHRTEQRIPVRPI